jgi:Fasciclin domain
VFTSLHSNNEYLTAVLSNHLVFEVLPTVNIANGQSYATLGGQAVHFTYANKATLLVNDANIIKSDVHATNGILHIIDKVLLEPFSSPSDPALAENNDIGRIDTSGAKTFMVSRSALLPVVVALACLSW